jgi:methionyl-tRNA formyltransferase
VLARLATEGHEIVAVLTQPDRPAGRGLQAQPSAVKRFAVTRGIPVLQPDSLRSAGEIQQIRSLRADALVVAAYGLILPREMLDAGRFGALNIHASLLPRWRGAAPIQRAILAGDRETGVSIMQMDVGLDTGPVLMQKRLPVAPDDDAASLHDKLAVLGAEAIVATLRDLEAGRARAAPQPEEGVTYAAKIDKRDAHLDWSRPAAELERVVRALRPAPGAFGLLGAEPVKIWRARVADAAGTPGTVLSAGDELVIGCSQNALAVSELQRAGGRRLSAAEFLRGRPLAPGARFA